MSLVPVSISHPPALAFDLQELCCGIKECQYWMPQAALHIHHVQVPSWMEMDAGIQPRRDHELIFILTPIQEDTYHVFSLHRIIYTLYKKQYNIPSLSLTIPFDFFLSFSVNYAYVKYYKYILLHSLHSKPYLLY